VGLESKSTREIGEAPGGKEARERYPDLTIIFISVFNWPNLLETREQGYLGNAVFNGIVLHQRVNRQMVETGRNLNNTHILKFKIFEHVNLYLYTIRCPKNTEVYFYFL
jgi:hypothetical protein